MQTCPQSFSEYCNKFLSRSPAILGMVILKKSIKYTIHLNPPSTYLYAITYSTLKEFLVKMLIHVMLLGHFSRSDFIFSFHPNKSLTHAPTFERCSVGEIIEIWRRPLIQMCCFRFQKNVSADNVMCLWSSDVDHSVVIALF